MLHNIILALCVQTLEFWSCPFKHCYSGPMLLEDWNSGLFLYKGWNSGPTLSNKGIPALFFQTLEFQPYPFKHWNLCPVLLNISILALFL